MGLRLFYSRLRFYAYVFIAIVFFLAFNLYYIKPVRNLLLKPFWPNVWRKVSTSDILMMKNIKMPPNVTDVYKCPKIIKPKTQYADVNQDAMLKYKDTNEMNPLFQNEIYAGFLPGISYKERVDTLLLYQVFAEAMKNAEAQFFFVGGSLLGIFRHGGSIPWDTDIDLAVNGSQWKKVKAALSCLEGYEVKPKWHMHWKFHFKDRYFPFIDLFFFTENERYLWAMNHYTLYNVLYEKKYIVPLSLGRYEGVMVPVPAQTEYNVRLEFDVEYCYPPDTNHRTGKHYKKTLVLCSDMGKAYPMQNLWF